jgi:cytochrome c
MKAPRIVVAFVVVGACGASVGTAQTAGTGDVAKGATAFRAHCAACHGADASGGSGPDLRDVVGRAAAGVPDFAYSTAMRRAGKTWTAAELQAFLVHPQSAVPGTRMAFAGTMPADASAVVAYLMTVK